MPVILQSNNFGTNPGPVLTPWRLIDNYATNTTAGSLLLCIVASQTGYTVPPGQTPPTINTPTTPGFIWTLAASYISDVQLSGAITYQASVAIYYIANAAPMSSSTTTTITFNINGNFANPGLNDGNTACDLIEVSGVSAVDVTSFSKGLVPLINAGNITFIHSDFVLVASDQRFLISAVGSGFSFLDQAGMNTSGILQAQYILNAPPGTYNTSFALGGDDPVDPLAWACVAVAFTSSSPTPILQVSPLALTFSAIEFGLNPASQNVAVSNGDGGTLNWVVSPDQPWLSCLPTSGTGNGTLVTSANSSGLLPGIYIGHLTVTAAGATGSPQIVTVTLNILTSSGGGGGGTPCIPNYTSGLFVPDLSLYIQPATALYVNPVPTASIAVNESTTQGRNAIILDFNNSEGLYARDLGVVFSWPISSKTVLDLWQPTIIPEQDDLYNRLSYHFLINALGLTGWGHIRELNIAHNATANINLLLQFDQWPDINITIPHSSGLTTKVKVVLPANKFKMVEGFLSSSQPFMLWGESCELKLGQWGRSEGYNVLKPFSG